MARALLLSSVVGLALVTSAAEPDYPRQVTRWHEVSSPPVSDVPAYMVWEYAANYSRNEWRVFANHAQICAQLTTAEPPHQPERPNFAPKADPFRNASAFARVDDGWLIGFNEGEWGGALWWFSTDGKSNYKVSDHQIVEFFSLPNGLHAIEGNLTMSEGSVVRIAPLASRARWRAVSVLKLPPTPKTVSVRHDGKMLITLSDALVCVDDDNKITLLLKNAPWRDLYPNSSILSADEERLYIGMRQFVGEFDIPTKKLRLLIPSDAFLNKLPKQDEQRILKGYGGG